MTPSGPHEALIARLLDLPIAEREGFLRRAFADDPALCDRLPEILRRIAEAKEGAAVGDDFPRVAPRRSDSDRARALETALRLNASDVAGTRIGAYKLLQQIGEGGFGVVWMADQEAPIRRRVALKIIKVGMDTREFTARFEVERQALALMDHPNIAHVFDAGTTYAGRPFFVMELVRGVPITRYCDDSRLTTEQRLRLFIPVCLAVQHAHQKGVIHRDLKPSNILVTLHDGLPVPKIIDFGIAKATSGARLTDRTLFTQLHAFIGTPAYTSPEQMEMSGLDVDTRSDIYGLGVLLYELLAGRPPFDPDALAKSGLEAMRRTIREIDPPRPSNRLETLPALDRTTVSRQRATEAVRLISVLRGDLDAIVMHCLEKDRTRRYESAGSLANDIGRYLGHEPVAARAPSQVYRVHKFIRRHKLGVAAATAVVGSLVFGLGAAAALLARERTAHGRAVASERAEAALRRQAEEAGQAETIRASRTARDLAGQLFAQGRTAEGLAYLVHAARKNPRDATLAPRLASALTQHNFLLPAAPPVQFPSGVAYLAYLDAGRRIAVFCDDGTIGFIDAATGAQTRTRLPSALAPPGVVFAGRVAIVRGADDVVRVLDPGSGRIEREFDFGRKIVRISVKDAKAPIVFAVLEDLSWVVAEALTGRTRTMPFKHSLVARVELSPDGRWLVRAVAPYRAAELWDTVSGQRVAVRDLDAEPVSWTISPDGTRLVLLTLVPPAAFTLRQWSVPELADLAAPESTFAIAGNQFPEVSFSPEGRVFGVASPLNQQLYDAHSGARRGALLASGFTPMCTPVELAHATLAVESPRPKSSAALFFRADGNARFITSNTGTEARIELLVRDVATGQPVLPPLNQGVALTAMRASEDGETLFTLGRDGSMRLWDLRTGRLRTEPGRQWAGSEIRVALSPDGSELVVGGANGTVQRLRAGRGPARPLALPRRGAIFPLRFLARSPAQLFWLRRDGAVVFDAASASPVGETIAFPVPVVGMIRGSQCFAVRWDQRFIAAQTSLGPWQVWELAEDRSRILRTVPLENPPAGAGWIHFSRMGDLMAFVSEQQVDTFRLWNVATGRSVGSPLRHEATMPWHYTLGTEFSEDGRHFAATSADGVVTIWDTATSNVVARWTPHRGAQDPFLHFNRDGTRLATTNSFGVAQLWPAPLGHAAGMLLAGSGHVDGLSFSPSGDKLVTWSRGGSARVWDGYSGAAMSEPMTHGGAGIRWAAFSSDGRRVGTVAQDGTARIWEANTGQPVTETLRHGIRLAACAFSPDGHFLQAGQAGSPTQIARMLVWSVPPDTGKDPAPEWLLRLATVCAAKKIDLAGQCVDLPEAATEWEEVRRRVAALPPEAPLAEWGHWFLDDRAERSIAPGFTATAAAAEQAGQALISYTEAGAGEADP